MALKLMCRIVVVDIGLWVNVQNVAVVEQMIETDTQNS